MSRVIEKHRLFNFKQFSLSHQRSAMKIGTDGVLLGAWAGDNTLLPVNVLDVGCGCGLISMMIAQRYEDSIITGIDIDSGSICDARDNIDNSPWKGRVDIIEGDFFDFKAAVKYDMILSNPPFFTADVHSPFPTRDTARSAQCFPIDDFARKCMEILSPTGCVNIIYPYSEKENVFYAFYRNGLYMNRICYVRDSSSTPVKRVMMSFTKSMCDSPQEEYLSIRGEDKAWSEQYKNLTRDFHPQIED